MVKRTTYIITIIVALLINISFGALVDIDGNTFTNESVLADLDMAAATLGDLKDGIAPDYSTISSKALNAVNDSMAAVTNTVVVGYTDYTYSGDVDPDMTSANGKGTFCNKAGSFVLYGFFVQNCLDLRQVV